MAASKSNNTTTILLLVIVILVLLLAGAYLFQSRSGSSPNSLTSSCSGVANSSCQSPSYNHSNGNLTVQIKQNSGTNWSVATVIFVPNGTPTVSGVPSVSWSSGVSLSGGLNNGVATSVQLPVSGKTSIGSSVSGTLWVQYQTNAGGTYYYTELGSVHAIAV
jgi:hypothetical protein